MLWLLCHNATGFTSTLVLAIVTAIGHQAHAPPTALTGHAGAVVGNRMFVCGGMGLANEGHYFREASLVDPVTGSWEPLPEPSHARGMAAAAELNGSVYLAGGLAWSNDTLRSVERFDLAKRTWSNVPALATARSRFCLVALGGRLYAVSGMNAAGLHPLNTATVEVYDPSRNAWSPAGALNHARHGFACEAYGGRIYVFGGNDSESARSAEVWDPRSGKSVDLPAMPVGRGFCGIVRLGERVIVFGGRSAHGHPSAFDVVARRWSEVGAPDIEINRCVAIGVGDVLWTIGGESRGRAPVIQRVDMSAWK